MTGFVSLVAIGVLFAAGVLAVVAGFFWKREPLIDRAGVADAVAGGGVAVASDTALFWPRCFAGEGDATGVPLGPAVVDSVAADGVAPTSDAAFFRPRCFAGEG